MNSEYECPNCGCSDEWVADYYEAVWQSISLYQDEDGEPVFGDYTGTTGSYDEGSTSDEAYKCNNCDYVICLGVFMLLSEEEVKLVQNRRNVNLQKEKKEGQ